MPRREAYRGRAARIEIGERLKGAVGLEAIHVRRPRCCARRHRWCNRRAVWDQACYARRCNARNDRRPWRQTNVSIAVECDPNRCCRPARQREASLRLADHLVQRIGAPFQIGFRFQQRASARPPRETHLVWHNLHQAYGTRPADQTRIAFGFFFDKRRNKIRIEAVVRGILRNEVRPLRDVGLPVGTQRRGLACTGKGWLGPSPSSQSKWLT